MSLYHNLSLPLVNLDVRSTVVPTVKHVHRYAQSGRRKGEGEEVHRREGFLEGGRGRERLLCTVPFRRFKCAGNV